MTSTRNAPQPNSDSIAEPEHSSHQPRGSLPAPASRSAFPLREWVRSEQGHSAWLDPLSVNFRTDRPQTPGLRNLSFGIILSFNPVFALLAGVIVLVHRLDAVAGSVMHRK